MSSDARCGDSVGSRNGDDFSVDSTAGWAGAPARAAGMIDDPALIEFTRAIVEIGTPSDLNIEVHAALASALAQSSSPTVVGECLNLLLSSGSALEALGERLYTICLQRPQPPAPDADAKAWLLAADALEAATRLALGDWVPRFGILAKLMQLPAVAPPLFARAALRCVAASYERWREPELVTTLERLAGLSAPAADAAADLCATREWTHNIAPDAAYELGCVSLLQAIGADALPEAEQHLQAAGSRLEIAADDRDDAAVLADVVRLLLAHLPTDAGQTAQASTDLPALADRLERRVREHVIGYAQLGHWRSPRLDAEVAWAHLAHDVVLASRAVEQDSWYHAEQMLANVLAAYTASRCSRVMRRDDQAGVSAILGPSIEGGIAIRAGLMKHLEDHIRALEAAVDDGAGAARESVGAPVTGTLNRVDELQAARSLLDASRAQLAARDQHPKASGGAAPTLPDHTGALPLLHQLLGSDIDILTALSPDATRQIEAALVDRQEHAGGPLTGRDALIVEETLARLRPSLAGSPYYYGDVKRAVNEVLVLLVRFWVSRDGGGQSYLFKPDAVEEDLARDLKLWFDGTPHAGRTATEVRHVGGGRVDVACLFPSFRLYIELKKDNRDLSIVEMKRYLLQTGGYQGADVPMGFLAVLDLRDRTGPTPHIASCFEVVVLDDLSVGKPRYITTMLVPGNRTVPSAMH
ncbi:hypothetical protein [Pseudonocardia alni]|uniref:hypothetical protein n=1 Tax=Pseudonocardia alni TaxID=33907 RepID=UPI00280B9D93|nr:hypothetical protein [Pseudonocardia alni]